MNSFYHNPLFLITNLHPCCTRGRLELSDICHNLIVAHWSRQIFTHHVRKFFHKNHKSFNTNPLMASNRKAWQPSLTNQLARAKIKSTTRLRPELGERKRLSIRIALRIENSLKYARTKLLLASRPIKVGRFCISIK